MNVHKFNGKIMGTGGFIDISATSRKIVFCGTLTAGGLKTEVGEGSLRITQEGRVTKFVESLPKSRSAARSLSNAVSMSATSPNAQSSRSRKTVCT